MGLSPFSFCLLGHLYRIIDLAHNLNMKTFSNNQLERYPLYLRLLSDLRDKGETVVSSPYIAAKLGFSEELVRKDLQAVCVESGRPRKGRSIDDTISDLEAFLGYSEPMRAILVGAGSLGGALLRFPGFESSGLFIEAAFDSSPDHYGKQIAGKEVYPMDELSNYIKRHNIKLAVLTVPSFAAQEVAEILAKAGIEGIWNFAPVALEISPKVTVENINLASSLAVLGHRMKERRNKHHG